MGATSYSYFWVGKGTHRDAFNELREDARCENGHQQGYSGDIQTANGYSEYKRKLPRQGSNAWFMDIGDICETLDKGKCYYVEIDGAYLKRKKEQRGLKGRKGIKGYYFFGCGRD